MKTLGEQITVLRSDRNMTQEDLAEKIGVSRQAVTKWEANESTPELAKIIALADFFGISLDKLVGRDESLYDMVKDTVIECSANCRELYDGEDFTPFLNRFIVYMEKINVSPEQIVNGIMYLCTGDFSEAIYKS